MRRPLLKYACRIEGDTVRYRGQRLSLADLDDGSRSALALADGRTDLAVIAARADMEIGACTALFERAEALRMIIDGDLVLRDDGLISGLEIFWRLEALLLTWRDQSAFADGSLLARDIAAGVATVDQVEGFLLEQGHLLRAVPEELALAVANAPSEAMRLEFMEFYQEEIDHGEMLLKPLIDWIGTEAEIRSAVALPTTAALIQTYRNWACKDPLMYAVALMRDEASPLDDDVPEHEDIYAGIRKNYDVPTEVVDLFEWHAQLDRNNDHGFFALQIFRHVPVVDDERAARLIGALLQIIDLHDAFRWGVRRYYAHHASRSRSQLVGDVLARWKTMPPIKAVPGRHAADPSTVLVPAAFGM